MDNNKNTYDFGIIQLFSPTKEADVDYSIANVSTENKAKETIVEIYEKRNGKS